MKKWILLIVSIIILFIICIYLIIPSNITVSAVATAKATRDGSFRVLIAQDAWSKWWNYNNPKQNQQEIARHIFNYDGYVYKLKKAGFDNALIAIWHNDKTITANVLLLQLSSDSIGIMFQTSLQTTANPFERIDKYSEAINLKKILLQYLQRLKHLLKKDENIYGIKITETVTRDSFLISKKQMFTHQPSTNEIYSLINDLKTYAAEKKCVQTNAPMLNILEDSNTYRLMVALPIDKEITAQPPVSFIKMVNGNFMTTKVQGGPMTVENALQQMQLYFSDYNKTSMAITFQYLDTDRMKETDTTKWITEIYAPVM